MKTLRIVIVALAALGVLSGRSASLSGERQPPPQVPFRAGIDLGRPRKIGSDYLGVDVNVAARVVDAAHAGEVLVSQSACERLDPGAFSLSRGRRLRARGAPEGLSVCAVSA